MVRCTNEANDWRTGRTFVSQHNISTKRCSELSHHVGYAVYCCLIDEFPEVDVEYHRVRTREEVDTYSIDGPDSKALKFGKTVTVGRQR
ncbi:hypothetical protein CQ020_01510 [Arthrobacter sp. MYb23]|uniref:hypothetical protein n=1 Tax=unclassified Arthrobacter TaxID=235627 RepID=UPI000CFF106D|nr:MULTISPECIES: hypothetical protein [unclassified Arthrobacter]PRB99495.1 hypothetical protein CQ020_01510 [Arthrobacter sp. MYb23]